MPSLHYTLTPIPHRHLFQIDLQIRNTRGTALSLYLPNWIAGSYMIRDFAQHIVSISAHDDKGAIDLRPTSQHSWSTPDFVGHLNIRYEVFAHDTSVRTAFLDGNGGFFNATSLCLTAHELAMQPHHLHLNAPVDYPNWQVATTLPRADGTWARDFGEHKAHNYDELTDHPVRFGDLTWLEFSSHGVLHEVALAGTLPYLDKNRLVTDLHSICAAQLALFEPQNPTQAPFKRYVFMVDVRSSGYGGLEHRSSTALLCERGDLPVVAHAEKPRNDSYINFLGLCSHEYFHSWNVKRIKPANFVQYDLTRITDTSLLWFFEGVTSYYDDLIMYRVGILDAAQYLKKLENGYNSVVRHDGANRQTVHDSGYYAWTKYYQTSANTPNAVVSYYSKGALIALAMDLFIRNHSESKHSLDDVMRDLWMRFGRDFYQLYPQGAAQGVTEADIIQSVARFSTANDTEVHAFFQNALHSTNALPLPELLTQHGMLISEPKSSIAQLGASTKKVDGGWQIQRVLNGSAAQQAGLAPDDVLIAFDTLRLNQSPDDTLAKINIGVEVSVYYFRDDVLQKTKLVNAPAPHGVYEWRLAEGQKDVFNII
ncbi:M61 family metallopeptidase [Hydromonas duriensis]|uniref:Putative metalloprotease with PDZ domain n=1 Tax=Hydromonas duriensis TaxID=1527608 RepID=A0A4R6YA26_9BURK|nr:PDZ domain-containing protein [Hydromonas duriensis]TDR32380.1 putative metalloprotease with PDZ domain [Hydromonas duriensis]